MPNFHSGNGDADTTTAPRVSITTFTETQFSGGNFYETLQALMSRRPSGVLTLHLNQGGIIALKWVEKTPR